MIAYNEIVCEPLLCPVCGVKKGFCRVCLCFLTKTNNIIRFISFFIVVFCFCSKGIMRQCEKDSKKMHINADKCVYQYCLSITMMYNVSVLRS